MNFFLKLVAIAWLSFLSMCAPMPTFTVENQLLEKTWVGRIAQGDNCHIKERHYKFLIEDQNEKSLKSCEYNIFKIAGATVIYKENGVFKLWSPNSKIKKYDYLNTGKVVHLRGKLVCDEHKYRYPGQLILLH